VRRPRQGRHLAGTKKDGADKKCDPANCKKDAAKCTHADKAKCAEACAKKDEAPKPAKG
jgi:hypothetical protein